MQKVTDACQKAPDGRGEFQQTCGDAEVFSFRKGKAIVAQFFYWVKGFIKKRRFE